MSINIGVRESKAPLIYIEGFILAALLLAEIWYDALGFGAPMSHIVEAIRSLHEAAQFGTAGVMFLAFVVLMRFVPLVFWIVAISLSLGVAWFAHKFYLETLGHDPIWAAVFAVAIGLILLFLHWQARADANAQNVDILQRSK